MATESGVDWVPDESDFETVETESGAKIEFPTVGSTFVGVYAGTVRIEPENGEAFDQQQFRKDGTLYAINGGFKLRRALEKAKPGDVVRITYMGEVDTGQPSPMRDFRVEIASKKGGAAK